MEARPLALAITLLIFLSVVVTPEVAIDPDTAYVGGVDTSAQSIGYMGSGIDTSAQNLNYMSGITTSAQALNYMSGISTSANRLGYTTGGISTKANKLSYKLNCFIYVNNSWFGLRITAKLDDGTPISVPVTVNGTSYTVPTSGLLLNWSKTAPVCGYTDPIANVSFPQSEGKYALKTVEGVQGNTVSWPPFTVYNITAIYTVERTSPPPSSSSSSGGQGGGEGGGSSKTPLPTGYVFILWWLMEFINNYWWLLILTLMLIIAVYKYHKHRGSVSVEINIPNWAVRGH